ncbi:putative reverse transcriptase domain-containing protein [Tanacetum coccineum]
MYEFWLQKVRFLRHAVNNNDIYVDSSYSRRVIVNSSKVAKPLASLTQKIWKYEWAKEQEEAFQTLKDNLCDAPILSLPDGSKEFVVYCDASNQGLGCVLMKRGKVENATAEMLRGLDQLMERKEDGGMKFIWVPLIDDVRTLIMDEAHASRLPRSSSGYDTNWVIVDRLTKIVTRHGVHVSIISDRGGKIYFAALVDIAEGIENTAKTCVRLIIPKRTDKDTHLPLTEFSIIIVIIRVFDVLYLKRCMEGSVGHMFFGLKLEKFGRLDQNWYKRQQIRVEVGNKVMLEVSSWKDVVHFGKKEMLAPRYYWTDANLHVHLEKIKVDKTLHFVKEPVEIIDREVKSLKRSRIPIVKSIRTRIGWLFLLRVVILLFVPSYGQAKLVEVGDKVMLEVSSWKDVVHFGKKEMLAPRYYWTDANLHVHLEEIKVDKTLHFVKEPVEIIDREVKSLKCSRIPIVKSIGTRSEVMRIS